MECVDLGISNAIYIDRAIHRLYGDTDGLYWALLEDMQNHLRFFKILYSNNACYGSNNISIENKVCDVVFEESNGDIEYQIHRFLRLYTTLLYSDTQPIGVGAIALFKCGSQYITLEDGSGNPIYKDVPGKLYASNAYEQMVISYNNITLEEASDRYGIKLSTGHIEYIEDKIGLFKICVKTWKKYRKLYHDITGNEFMGYTVYTNAVML